MTDEEKLTLWLGAFRYYCGRMTYAVSDFCDLLCKEWDNLPEYTKNLIKIELESIFQAEGKSTTRLGAPCDRAEWEKVRALWGEK